MIYYYEDNRTNSPINLANNLKVDIRTDILAKKLGQTVFAMRNKSFCTDNGGILYTDDGNGNMAMLELYGSWKCRCCHE